MCCSTDPSVPPASSVYNISTTSGTDVTVSLGGLTSGQMYYCMAAATNITSTQCSSSVVGGVKLFFSFVTTTIVPSVFGMILHLDSIKTNNYQIITVYSILLNRHNFICNKHAVYNFNPLKKQIIRKYIHVHTQPHTIQTITLINLDYVFL